MTEILALGPSSEYKGGSLASYFALALISRAFVFSVDSVMYHAPSH